MSTPVSRLRNQRAETNLQRVNETARMGSFGASGSWGIPSGEADISALGPQQGDKPGRAAAPRAVDDLAVMRLDEITRVEAS